MLKNYYEFLNETHMTDNKEGFHLELNDNGKKLIPFIEYYTENNKKYYFVLKYIDYDEYDPINNRVTLLSKTNYKDTDFYNKGVILKEIDLEFDRYNYYFYKLVYTKRNRNEPIDVVKRYTEYPELFQDYILPDRRNHYIVIKKYENNYNVRLNSGGRYGAGDRAEKIIKDKFKWEFVGTKIQKYILTKIDKHKNILPKATEKTTLWQVLEENPNLYNNFGSLFELSEPDKPVLKYDLLISNGPHAGEIIEIKKYDAKDLFYVNSMEPKDILVSEQHKISNIEGLKKLVDLYKKLNPNINIQPLLDCYHNKREQLSSLFNANYKGEYSNLVNDIRKLYNDKIEYIFNLYKNIPKNLIMKKVYGIYFFNKEVGYDGFMIRNINDNITYHWKLIIGHWGLKRITLFMNVNPNSKRMVWLGDDNTFVETYDVGSVDIDLKDYYFLIRNTSLGTIVWDQKKGYWIKVKRKYKNVNGLDLLDFKYNNK